MKKRQRADRARAEFFVKVGAVGRATERCEYTRPLFGEHQKIIVVGPEFEFAVIQQSWAA